MRCMFDLLFLAIVISLSACAGTKIVRNSMPGLDVTGKKIWVLVDENRLYSDFTVGLDSVWREFASSNKMEIEYTYNAALSLHPVSPAALFESCGDSYLLRTFVSGSSKTQTTDASGMVYGGATVEYTSTMYSCKTQQVVWKMILTADGSIPTYSQRKLVSGIFDDFKTNSILKE